MIHGTRLTRQNIHIIASEMDIPVEELEAKRVKVKLDFQDEQAKAWAMHKLGKDNLWFEATREEIEKTKETLPKNMNYRDKTKKLYGWVADKFPKMYLSIPMESDGEYARAACIEAILNNPSNYHKLTSWD